jgi:hypothetical protein
MKASGASIRRILVVVNRGNIRSRIRNRHIGRYVRVKIACDKTDVAVHKTDVHHRIAVLDILGSIQVFVPGVGPLQRPFCHQPGACGMHDAGHSDIVQVQVVAIVVIAAIIDIASVIKCRVCRKGSGVTMAHPAPIHRALENEIVARGSALVSNIRFVQFLVPPPDGVSGSIDDYRVRVRKPVLIVCAIHYHGQVELLELAQALGLDGLGLGLGQRGQEQSGQDGDDGDDHQQLNQRERPAISRAVPIR